MDVSLLPRRDRLHDELHVNVGRLSGSRVPALFVHDDLRLDRHETELMVDRAHPHVLVVAARAHPSGVTMSARGGEAGGLDGSTEPSSSVLREDQSALDLGRAVLVGCRDQACPGDNGTATVERDGLDRRTALLLLEPDLGFVLLCRDRGGVPLQRAVGCFRVHHSLEHADCASSCSGTPSR
jgi:hypothetical protein